MTTATTTTTDRERLTDAALAHGWRPIPHGDNWTEFWIEDWVLTVWFDRAGALSTVSRPVSDLSRFDAQRVLRTVEWAPITDEAVSWALDKLATVPTPTKPAATVPAPPTKPAATAQFLTDTYLSRISPLHKDLYELLAATRTDPQASRALRAALSTACAAVSTLAEAVNAVTELLDQQ